MNRSTSRLWRRCFEEHREYAYTRQELERWLGEAGFTLVSTEKTEDEPSDDTRADGEGAKGEKAAGSTFFKGLNSAIENH